MRKNFIFLLSSIVCLLFLYNMFKGKQMHQAGTIVLLNGPSASGKSSLQKEFQKINEDLYLTIGIDGFFDQILPDVDDDGKSIKNNEIIRWIDFGTDDNGNQLITLHVADLGFRVIQGMHRAIAAYAQQNNNLIVDYILYDQRWLPDLIKALEKYKVYLVGINAPLEVIEKRESKRGTSPIGHARSHYYTVHENMMYDLELDSSVKTAPELAQEIKNFIKNNPEPVAFKKLHEKIR